MLGLSLGVWALLASACGPGAGSDTAEVSRRTVKAVEVGEATAAEILFDEVRPDGEQGDYALYNDQAIAIIDRAEQDAELGVPLQEHRAPTGGTLLDLAPREGVDHLVQLYQCVNFDPDLRLYYETVEIVEEGAAIRAVGGLLDPGRSLGLDLDENGLVPGLVAYTTYRMEDGGSWVELETTLSNETRRTLEIDDLCDVVITDGGGLEPFVPSPGWGWSYTGHERISTPWVAFAGAYQPPASYAVAAPDHDFVDIEPLTEGRGWLRGVVVGTPVSEQGVLGSGERRVFRRLLFTRSMNHPAGTVSDILDLLGSRGGSSAVTLGLTSIHTVDGRVDPPMDADLVFHRVHPDRYVGTGAVVYSGGVMPITAASITEDTPEFRIQLPLGEYEVEVQPEAGTEEWFTLEVDDETVDAPITFSLEGEPPSPVSVSLVDGEGEPLTAPARLTVVGLGGTSDPELSLSGNDVVAAGNRVWLQGGSAEIPLAEGSYRIHASRGILYDLTSEDFNVPATESLTLTVDDSPLASDRVSFDPVLGSRISTHGNQGMADIARAATAEGITWYARSEAQAVEDPVTAEGQAGAGTGLLGTLDVPRKESPEGDGWFAALPASRAVPGPGVQANRWLEAVYDEGAVFTVILGPRVANRTGVGVGLFEARDLDREAGLASPDNGWLTKTTDQGIAISDATALEILSARDPWGTGEVVDDWFVLLDEGLPFVPAASSCAADLEIDPLGAARMMVDHDGEGFDDLLASAAAGHLYVTTGPLIEMAVHGAEGTGGPGETVVADGGTVQVELEIRTADWIDVDLAQLWVNGELAHRWDSFQEGGLSRTAYVDIDQGGWIVLTAGRATEAPEAPYADIYPNMPIYAATAPVWVEP